jgi:hypothetical protein
VLILKAAKSRFPRSTPQSKIWKLCQEEHKFVVAIHHGNYDEAEKAITNMTVMSPLQAGYCRCLLLKEKGMVQEALNLSASLKSQCEESSQQDHPQLYPRLDYGIIFIFKF